MNYTVPVTLSILSITLALGWIGSLFYYFP